VNRVGFSGCLAGAKRCLFGTWVKIESTTTVEILADAGFDFVVIDQEHSPLTMEAGYRAMVAAQGLGLQVLVRVPDRSGSYLQRLLDSGVDGILVPRVTSAQEAAFSVAEMLFPPQGSRGFGGASRAGRWGGISRADYLDWGDSQVMRGVQLEDRAAIENVEAIMSVPGLNGVFLGMADLSLSMQRHEDDPEVQALVERFLLAGAAHSVACGTAVQTPSEALAAAGRGYSFVMVSNDAGLFRSAATTLVAQIRERLV
jgi:2-keto-3-deoxy-L-rhamnonate aldolase RhmA